jgi:hypothetical protein
LGAGHGVFRIKVGARILIETNENRNKRNDAASSGSCLVSPSNPKAVV